MSKKGFKGWYFRHQKGENTVSFIPGTACGGGFIQVITSKGSWQFKTQLTVDDGTVRAGDCLFSRRGCTIELPGIKGEIKYGAFTQLRSDIMGPFRFLPMECRHGVISMGHSLQGELTVDGETLNFDGGRGYIESDCGVSFPRSYLWVQCNALPDIEFMASVARIPFCGAGFTGCICAIIKEGREYRIATYCGAKAETWENGIRLKQRNTVFEAEVIPGKAYPLRSPRNGYMNGIIRESVNARVRARLTENGKYIFEADSPHAAYECFGEQ